MTKRPIHGAPRPTATARKPLTSVPDTDDATAEAAPFQVMRAGAP
jgi:hypothetical protein